MILQHIFCGAIGSAVAIYLLAKAARALGYVDLPGGRKQHRNVAFPVGGLGVFLVVVVGLMLTSSGLQDYYFLAASGLVVLAGAIDEFRPVSVRLRIFVEVCASLIMVFGAGILLSDFGDLLGFGNIYLPLFIGVLFTVIAVFGTLNAWNMVDGIDGLAGTLAILSLATLLVITVDHETLPISLYLVFGGLFSFLVFNFSSGKVLPKVFLGDSGSKLIGFCLVWFLIRDTQIEGSSFSPVTALFVMGLPIIDMTTTVLNRLRAKQSPFKPDRTHLHHLLLDMGCSKFRAYLIIVTVGLSLNAFALVLHFVNTPEYVQLGIYGMFFIMYFSLLNIKKKALLTESSRTLEEVSC